MAVDSDLPGPELRANVRYDGRFTADQVAVVRAWANYRHVLLVAFTTPSPQDDRLARYADPELVERRRAETLSLVEGKRRYRAPEPSRQRETVGRVDIEDGTALLWTCELNDLELLDSSTGQVIASGLETYRYVMTLRRSDGRWLVTREPPRGLRKWTGDEEAQCLD